MSAVNGTKHSLVMGLVACFVGLTAACAAMAQPAWITAPPADTAEAWFAGGEGPDLESARRNALRAVAARLRSVISGQISDTVTDSNGRIDRRSLSAVSENVLQTEFSRFDVVQSAKGGVGVFALVKVDRPAFITDTRTQLQVVAKPIAEAQAALPSQATLDQFLALRRLKPQIDKALGLSLLLQGAGEQAEGRAGVLRYGGLAETSRALASKLTFELQAKPEDGDVATALAALLATEGMRTARARTAGANVLTIASSGRQDDLYGSKLVRLDIRLSVQDAQGRAVSSREHVVSGSSRYDFVGARKAAVDKLETDLKGVGVLRALGLSD